MPRTTKPPEKRTGRDVMIQLLREANGPLKAKAITSAAVQIATGLLGPTPEQTLNAMLYVSARKADGVFVKTGKGEFDLRERHAAPARRRRRAKEES